MTPVGVGVIKQNSNLSIPNVTLTIKKIRKWYGENQMCKRDDAPSSSPCHLHSAVMMGFDSEAIGNDKWID